jgi:hypothetical protein
LNSRSKDMVRVGYGEPILSRILIVPSLLVWFFKIHQSPSPFQTQLNVFVIPKLGCHSLIWSDFCDTFEWVLDFIIWFSFKLSCWINCFKWRLHAR